MLQDVHTPEFLNSLKCYGVPNHEIYLKEGTPVMLSRNIVHASGLCNGKRLVITRLGSHILEAKVLINHNINASGKVLIPPLSITPAIRKVVVQISTNTISTLSILCNDYR